MNGRPLYWTIFLFPTATALSLERVATWLTTWHTCHVLLNLPRLIVWCTYHGLFLLLATVTANNYFHLTDDLAYLSCLIEFAALNRLVYLPRTLSFACHVTADNYFHLTAWHTCHVLLNLPHLIVWCTYHILLMHLLLSYTLTSLGVLILCLAVLTFSHSLIRKFAKQKISNLANLVGLSTK